MNGIEKAYEKVLRGEKGMKYIQKDIKLRNIGSYKNGELDKEMVSGKDLVLTIDYDLQRMAEEMLVNKRGAIVAIDPNNGEILAMATGPDIDPNLFTGPEKTKNLYRLQMDSMNKPMFDRSIQAAYPPGSTFKLVTALSAMQMGVMFLALELKGTEVQTLLSHLSKFLVTVISLMHIWQCSINTQEIRAKALMNGQKLCIVLGWGSF